MRRGFSTGAYEILAKRAGSLGVLLEEAEYDHTTDQLVIRRTQDCNPILEHNKEQALWTDGYTPSREMRRVAQIPNIIVEQWMKEGVNIFDDNCWPEIRRRLNDPEWRHLRTCSGRI